MNCYFHPDTPGTAFCRSCGKSLCEICQRPAAGTVFCEEHAPAAAYSAGPDPGATAGPNPYFQAAPPPQMPPYQTSPPLAFVLGLIPGVGAIYNGQYLKGLIHALIFGLLVTIISNSGGSGAEALFGILLGTFVLYMPFEAFHTAKKRQMGVYVEEWSSILPGNRYAGSYGGGYVRRAPIGPIVLILIGVMYLLNSLDLLDFRQIGRFWPIILIVVGAYMLYNRMTAPAPPPGSQRANSANSGSTNHAETRP